jgi:hypothetical protein
MISSIRCDSLAAQLLARQAAGGQRLLEEGKRLCPDIGRFRTGLAGKRAELLAQRVAVDQFFELQGDFRHWASPSRRRL